MIDTKEQQLGTMFEILAGELDVPDQIYKDMVRKYQHLGGWIREDSKDKFRADAEIYPQGSVNLGTTIPPVDATCGYDVDLVYRRDLARWSSRRRESKPSVMALSIRATPIATSGRSL